MKRITALNLIFGVLLGLVYKGPAVFSSVQNKNFYQTAKTQSVAVTNLPAVQVVSLPPVASVAVETPVLQSACKTSFSENKNLVQDEGSINLNQPADCFSLKLETGKSLVKNLAVNILQQPSTVVLVVSTMFIESPDFAPAPLDGGNLPVLPAASEAFLAAVVVFRKKITESLIYLKNRQLLLINIPQLEVLRC